MQSACIGDRIWVHIPQHGYVGVGIIIEESQPAKSAVFEIDGNKINFTYLPLVGKYETEASEEEQEYLTFNKPMLLFE